MEKCILRQLDYVVDNNELKYFGGFVVNTFATTDATERIIAGYTTKKVKVSIIEGNITFLDANNESAGTIAYIQGGGNVKVSNGNGKILFEDKYNWWNFQIQSMPDGGASMDIAECAYMNAAGSATLGLFKPKNFGYGNISELTGISSITDCDLMNANVYGKLEEGIVFKGRTVFSNTNIELKTSQINEWTGSQLSMINMPYLTGAIGDVQTKDISEWYIVDSKNVTGTVENFFEKQWALGKRSGNNRIQTNHLKYNNELLVTSAVTYYGAYDENGITVTINGSTAPSKRYNGSTWSLV